MSQFLSSFSGKEEPCEDSLISNLAAAFFPTNNQLPTSLCEQRDCLLAKLIFQARALAMSRLTVRVFGARSAYVCQECFTVQHHEDCRDHERFYLVGQLLPTLMAFEDVVSGQASADSVEDLVPVTGAAAAARPEAENYSEPWKLPKASS